MKEKILAMTMVLALSFGMMGCGETQEKQISGDVHNNNQETNQETNQASNQKDNQANETLDAYVFVSNGTQITIGTEAKGIIEKLGEPLSKYESPSCAFGDLDVSYTYGGFELDTYQQDGVDYVSAVILQDDSVETPEGLYIGEEEGRVEEIYGEPTSTVSEGRIYNKGDMKLTILCKDGKVASIQYLNTVLD